MRRKWIVLAGVALILGVVATVAAAERGEKMWAYRLPMPEHLDLSDEQKEQLQELREQHAEVMREQRETMAAMNKEHREALRAQRETMAALREEYREALENIFTDEQRARLGLFPIETWAHHVPETLLHSEMWAEQMLRGEHIDIESIKESMGDIRVAVEHWSDMRGIKSAFAKLELTDEQKEQLKDLDKAQREEFHKWRQKQRKAMENILTDEQRAKLEMLKDEAFYGGKYGFR